MKVWLITVGVFIVIVLALVLAYALSPSKPTPRSVIKERFLEASEKKKVETKKPSIQVMLFYAVWCPHCESYLKTGVFDTFADAVKKVDDIKADVTFKKYDYDQNQALGDRYGIASFPTIIAVDQDEKVYRFNGSRDKAVDIIKFVKAVEQKRSLSASDYA